MIESNKYSDAERFAVRYGYQYRVVAEENERKSIDLHYRLADASPFLLELAKWVISGVSYDVVKALSTKLWNKLMRMKVEIPDEVNKVLIDDDELRRFVVYVDEFNSKSLSSTPKVTRDIREEIIADYIGQKAGEISFHQGRIPNKEEWYNISKEAFELADKLLTKESKDGGQAQ